MPAPVTKRPVAACLALAALALAGTSCFRSDIRVARIRVPDMNDARAARIVTDTLGLELYWRADSNVRADLKKGFVYYAAEPFLDTPAWRQDARSALTGAGLAVEDLQIRRRPIVVNVSWPSRHVAAIRIADLDSLKVNVAVATLSRVSAGKEPDNVTADIPSRTVTVAYDSTRIAPRNLELAIACVGFAANDTPALLGNTNALPHGWLPDRNFEDWE